MYDTAAAASQAAAEAAAGILRDAIQAKGHAVFVAATGNSQLEFLKHLTAAPGISWKHTTMFHLDEYIGIPANHPASFRRYLRERLTSRVPVGNVHFICGDAPDLSAEVARLNAAIAASRGRRRLHRHRRKRAHRLQRPPGGLRDRDPFHRGRSG